MYKYIIIIVFISGISGDLFSQTKPCNINYFEGVGVTNSRIIGQYRDLILVSDTGSYKIIDIIKIKSIDFDHGSYRWTGVAAGAIAGFITGIVLYSTFAERDKKFLVNDPTLSIALVFTLPSALIGGVVGGFFKNRDHYDLSKMGSYMKAKEIRYIRNHHYNWN